MAFSDSKPLLLQMILIFSLLFMLNNVSSNNDITESYPPSSSPLPSPLPRPRLPLLPSNTERVSFGFSRFGPQPEFSAIALRGDASIADGVIQLTKKDNLGNPIKNSIGRAQYRVPIHLWDKTTGNLADFTTGFTFSLDRKGSTLHGDGLAFFLAPVDSMIPANSGGYLGLFSPQTALNNTNNNQIVAIKFSTYLNEWDRVSTFKQNNHVGISINSIRSVISAEFPEFDNGKVSASINYNSESKRLSVSVTSLTYPNRNILISHIIDLRTVLPEWVRVGFSAATSQFVETHDIFSWGFIADL